MEFNIDPKDLNLQDAAGMQLVEIIRNLAEESGTADYEDLENLPKINGVTLVGDKSSEDLDIAVSDEQVSEAVDAWLADNVDPETGYVLDSTLTMSNAAAPADKVGELKSEIALAQSGMQTFANYGNFQHYGLDSDGTFLTWQTYRVSNDDPMTFDHNLTIYVENGFRWGYIPFVDGEAGSWSGWITSEYVIESGTSFVVQIARVTEDNTEVADVAEFLDAVTFFSDLGEAVHNLEVTAKTIEWVISGAKSVTPAAQSMFEKTIFSEDVGYAPQGLAVNNNIAYVSNGATTPLDVITEIDLSDGTFTPHTIAELAHGANSLSFDAVNGLLYAAEHLDGGKVFIIDVSTWQCKGYKTLPSTISSTSENGWNIVYDPVEQCFYNYSNKTDIIYKLNTDFEIIKTIPIDIDDKYPSAKPGVAQGFGYDGTYFYIPRSEVYNVYGNSFLFVVDKNGYIVKYIRGCHDEIEEFAYDFLTGKSYVCYALSDSGYITEFVDDSGWVSINDYLSDNYQTTTPPTKVDLENTDAEFRVRNGSVYFRGKVKTSNNAGTLCYLDARIAPMLNASAIIHVTEGATFSAQASVVKVNLSATTYWTPDFQYKYVPILNAPNASGYWWFDGVSAPLGRE